MSENTNTFVLPSSFTTGTRRWIDSTLRREVSAAKADAEYFAHVVANYPEDLDVKVKSGLSGAVKALITSRTVAGTSGTAAHAARASKIVTRAWLTVGLTRNGVDVSTLPPVKVKDVDRDALSVVVNGEGGKPLAGLRKGVMDAAKEGRWAEIPSILADVPAPADSPETDPEAQDDANGTSEPVLTGADFSARNVHALLAALAKGIKESAIEYTEADNVAILSAMAEVEASVHMRTKVAEPAA